ILLMIIDNAPIGSAGHATAEASRATRVDPGTARPTGEGEPGLRRDARDAERGPAPQHRAEAGQGAPGQGRRAGRLKNDETPRDGGHRPGPGHPKEERAAGPGG